MNMKSPWTWLSTCIFQNILEYSITLLCTYTCTFCPHSHTKTRQRLNNNFQSENLPLLIFPKLLKRMHGISCWWYTCKHFSVTNNVIEHLYSLLCTVNSSWHCTVAQACNPPSLSYELLYKTLRKFCWGPLVCSFLFNFGAIFEIQRLPDFKPVDFFAVQVVFAPSILFQTLNFNVVIYTLLTYLLLDFNELLQLSRWSM